MAANHTHGWGPGTNYPYVNPNPYSSPIPAPTTIPYQINWNFDSKPKEAPMEQEYIVGDGTTTSFTFPTTDRYPVVGVWTREVEGEGDEQTITVTELGAAEASTKVIQGEQVTVTFTEAPKRRGAVILIS